MHTAHEFSVGAAVVAAAFFFFGARAVRAEDPAPAGGSANATGAFLGPEAGWGLCRLELLDVHGLWGGQNVYVEGSGRCVVRVVEPAQTERRFAFQLESQEALAVLRSCVSADLLSIRIPERPGVPDEAHPTLVLRAADGRAHTLYKWSNDKVPAFDGIYQGLLALIKKTEGLKPECTGPHDWKWRPWEAVVVTVSMFSGRPDPGWEIPSPKEWEAIRDRLQDLPETAKVNRPSLGYRGVILTARGVEGFPLRVTAWKGVVELEEIPGVVVTLQDAKGLEAWLLAEAKKRGIEVP
ncbi:MAG: hypothetical protein HYZ53_07965 [Planctomycetes bacterium]|nr:hypothetical protein [Planctomycetota bacterium]